MFVFLFLIGFFVFLVFFFEFLVFLVFSRSLENHLFLEKKMVPNQKNHLFLEKTKKTIFWRPQPHSFRKDGFLFFFLCFFFCFFVKLKHNPRDLSFRG